VPSRHRADGVDRPRVGITRDSTEIDQSDSLRLLPVCLIERLAINTRECVAAYWSRAKDGRTTPSH